QRSNVDFGGPSRELPSTNGLRIFGVMRVALLAVAVAIALVGVAASSEPMATAALTSLDQRAEANDAGDAARGGGTTQVPACMLGRGEERYVVYGYRHVVVLTNGCSKLALCSVATNVSPTPQSVEVKSGSTVEVVTFYESPASTFVAIVSCTLAK